MPQELSKGPEKLGFLVDMEVVQYFNHGNIRTHILSHSFLAAEGLLQ